MWLKLRADAAAGIKLYEEVRSELQFHEDGLPIDVRCHCRNSAVVSYRGTEFARLTEYPGVELNSYTVSFPSDLEYGIPFWSREDAIDRIVAAAIRRFHKRSEHDVG